MSENKNNPYRSEEEAEQFVKGLLGGTGLAGMAAFHPVIDMSGYKFDSLQEYGDQINNPLAQRTWQEALADEAFKDVSPEVKQAVQRYGLNTNPEIQDAWRRSGIPLGDDGFSPSDISKAGAFSSPPSEGMKRIFTVTPGPESQRFARLDPTDAFEADKAGYIWGVGDKANIQTSYADGNTSNKKRVVSTNPSVHVIDAELGSDRYRNEHLTTGMVRQADMSGRPWGYVKNPNPVKYDVSFSDNVYFPKEDIRRRGVASLADITTAIRERDPSYIPRSGEGFWGNTESSARQLQEAIDRLSELTGKSPTDAVAEVASPVPRLGSTTRKQGLVPQQLGIQWEKLTPELKKKIGLGTLFVDSKDFVDTFVDDGSFASRKIIPDPEDSIDLIGRTAEARDKLVRQNKNIGLAGAAYGLATDRSIGQALQEGRYGDAIASTALSGGTGYATEKALNFAGNRFAAAGSPRLLNALSMAQTAASPLAAIQVLAAAEKSTPEGFGSEQYQMNSLKNKFPERMEIDGQTYGYDKSRNSLVDMSGRRFGLAYKDGKPAVVPYGSVKGRTMAGQIFGLLGL